MQKFIYFECSATFSDAKRAIFPNTVFRSPILLFDFAQSVLHSS